MSGPLLDIPNLPSPVPRLPGRPKTLSVEPATVMLEPDLIEWGKQQDGGLSATIRRLLRRAMETAEEARGAGGETAARGDSPLRADDQPSLQ